MSDSHLSEIIVALIGLAGLTLAPLLVLVARRVLQIKEAVGEKQNDTTLTSLALGNHDRLVKLEAEVDAITKALQGLEQWKASYDNLPWSNGAGTEEWLSDFQSWQDNLTKRLTQAETELRELRQRK